MLQPQPSSSSRHPRVARLVAVGDELLSGDTVNTNATDLAVRCRELGLTLDRVVTVRDRIPEISAAVRDAASADVCFVCGGLGPTSDDLTAEALALAAGDTLVRDEAALARLEAKFAAMGYEMPDINRKQADFPSSATIVPNPIGSAEGFCVTVDGTPVYSMPGVPRELRRMFDDEIGPALAKRFELDAAPRRIYRAIGRGESSIAKLIEPIVAQARKTPGLESLFVHYRASTPQVLVVLEAPPSASVDVPAALASLDEAVLGAMSPALYGIGEATMAQRVVTALERANLRICTAESCTAGGLGATLTDVPGSSAVFDGGIIAYSNDVKMALLGVSEADLEAHGAVSAPVAKAMAEGARKATGSDLCVGITGIAGPGGGSPEKPVGTVHIDVFDGEVHLHKKLQLRGNRGTVRHCSQQWALKLVWDRLCARGLASPRCE
ncbi:MAG: CinA family nicotinamide mononucleotide deamidase-related protein [Nannocystaceae bacterium]|nr:CinA family nicotinamide mononucleotide deamidase-related protein [bacterium]